MRKRPGPERNVKLRLKFIEACKEARTIAEASRKVGVSRQRGHVLAKQLGITSSLQGNFISN